MASESTVTVVTIAQTIPIRLLPRSGGPSALAPSARKCVSAKPMKSSTKSSTGVITETSTVLSSTCPEAWTLPFPGGIWGPRKIATIGVRMTLATSQRIRKRRP